MAEYSQNFTLKDIFNCKAFRDVLPLVNYKESVDAFGKVHRRTNVETVPMLVYRTAKSSAKAFYDPLVATKSADHIEIDGNLISDYKTAYKSIYNALVGIKPLISMTANNLDMVRTALKESERSGNPPKLYLRVGSLQEINNMSNPQKQELMNNIMENIFFGQGFEKTQKKYDVENIRLKSKFTFSELKQKWQHKVGLTDV